MKDVTHRKYKKLKQEYVACSCLKLLLFVKKNCNLNFYRAYVGSIKRYLVITLCFFIKPIFMSCTFNNEKGYVVFNPFSFLVGSFYWWCRKSKLLSVVLISFSGQLVEIWNWIPVFIPIVFRHAFIQNVFSLWLKRFFFDLVSEWCLFVYMFTSANSSDRKMSNLSQCTRDSLTDTLWVALIPIYRSKASYCKYWHFCQTE